MKSFGNSDLPPVFGAEELFGSDSLGIVPVTIKRHDQLVRWHFRMLEGTLNELLDRTGSVVRWHTMSILTAP